MTSAVVSTASVRPAATAEPSGAESEAVEPSPVVTSADSARAGIVAFRGGDVKGSLEQFTSAVEADPQNAEALNNLGQVLVRTGRAREAIPYFDRAIAVAGGVWAYRFNRAKALAELKDWNLAITGYRDAARLFPDDYATAFNLARALQANGDLSGAIGEYQRAATLAPGEADFQLALGSALDKAQRPGEAVAAYRRYLELKPDAPQAEKIKERIAQAS